MTKKHEYTLSNSMRQDQFIMSLASYDISKGLTEIPTDIHDFSKKIQKKFIQFKKSVQNGEFSIRELEIMVVKANGPFLDTNLGMTDDEILDEMSHKEKNDEKTNGAVEFLNILLNGNYKGDNIYRDDFDGGVDEDEFGK
jgi:hypothetical protein